ncbi:MAG TPA: family 16 glycoside hydrolase, partial [Candidatus Eisenbacteria bacterium]|nr:family 16 glycoside hydrolase [Candidatus Eisenbacteria bacterium]
RPPAQGVLFADDFTRGLARWRQDRPGVWTVTHGMLRADLPDQRQLRSLLYAGSDAWTDVALDFDVCSLRGVDKGAVVRAHGNSGIGVDLRGGTYQDVVAYVREWLIARGPAANTAGAWSHVRIEARDNRCRVFVNGALAFDHKDAHGAPAQGRIALAAYTGGVGQCTVFYDNVVVTALAPAPPDSARR